MGPSLETIRGVAWKLAGGIYVPSALRRLPGSKADPRLLLLLCDLPQSVYGAVSRLCRRTLPGWILLAGDLTDDIKLELNPAFLARHRAALGRLAAALAPAEAAGARLLVALGNHDDPESVAAAFPRAEVFPGARRLDIGGRSLIVAHRAEEALALDAEAPGAQYIYHGHDLSSRGASSPGRRLLNGIESIALLDLAAGSVAELPWPAGTDEARLSRGKTGL